MLIENSFEMIAKTFAGLENILADELIGLGADKVETLKRGVRFYGDKKLMYITNLSCRTALYILKPISLFTVHDENDLYKKIGEIPWWKFMDVNQKLAVDAVVYHSRLTHSKYIALKTKDAIADQFRKRENKRPSVDIKYPDVKIHVHISNNNCTVSLNSSGDPLYKRGYRVSGGTAPLNEVLAAGLLHLSGWDKKTPLIDPMCGSGTIIIEAAMIANHIPPGILRKSYGFHKWKDFSPELWDQVLKEAKKDGQDLFSEIYGSDISWGMVKIARSNVSKANLTNSISVEVKDISEYIPDTLKGILVTNPPYGVRITPGNTQSFYKELGDSFKRNFTGFEAWVLAADNELIKHIGLRPSKKIIVFNGPIECRFVKFEMYQGSKKTKYGKN